MDEWLSQSIPFSRFLQQSNLGVSKEESDTSMPYQSLTPSGRETSQTFMETPFAEQHEHSVPQSFQYEMTLNGFRCPTDLKAFLDHGKPICFIPKLDATLFLDAARFPANSDLSSLTEPIQVFRESVRDISQTGSQLPTDSSNFTSFQTKKKQKI